MDTTNYITIGIFLVGFIGFGVIFWVRLGPRIDHLESKTENHEQGINQIRILIAEIAVLVKGQERRIERLEDKPTIQVNQNPTVR